MPENQAEPTGSPPRTSAQQAALAVVAAFGTYFCMYGFRKPFTAAAYNDPDWWGPGFKTLLVTSQVLGYMLSKFVGIRVVAELPRSRRAPAILILIGIAELALVLFALVPRPWNAACLLLNGLPLGMVFGMVLGFLEGRRLTEALTAGLCASFILADGVTKSVGTWILERGVSEEWMPSLAGLGFLGPLVVGVWMLSRIPPPDDHDVEARSERSNMTRDDRQTYYSRYAFGLNMIVVLYLLVTILRSIRADFAPEIWKGLGEPAEPSTYLRSEMLVFLGIMATSGLSVLIRDNRRAFFSSLAVSGLGFVVLGASLVGWSLGALGPFGYMVLLGLGLYLPYVAVHTTVFERLLAMTRDRGTSGYLMYVADAFGYLGYVAVMLGKTAWRAWGPGGSRSPDDLAGFFGTTCAVATALSLVCLALAWRYFLRISAQNPT